jgi:Patatin-like phospholipase
MADDAVANAAIKVMTVTEVLAQEFNTLHASQNQEIKTTSSPEEIYDAIHALRDNGQARSALCLSGGGIRSASFALGVLHGLAERGLLQRFTYLSTVSGGGYIGAWLTAWRHRRQNDSAIVDELSTRNHPDRDYGEAPEVSSLRAFSNYLTPRLGALSADTWTLGALFIRNLLLNWLIYLPLFVGVLTVPLWTHHVLQSAFFWPGALHHCLLVTAAVLLLVALTTSVGGRQGTRFPITQGRFQAFVLAPTYLGAMLICIYSVGSYKMNLLSTETWWGDVTWWKAALAGFVLYGASSLLARLVFGLRPDQPTKLLIGWSCAGAVAGALIGLGCELVKHHLPINVSVDSQSAMVAVTETTKLLVVLGCGAIALSMYVAESIYLGLTSYTRLSDVDREWLARSSGWFIALTLVWAALSAIALYAPLVHLEFLGFSHWLWATVIVGASSGAAAAGIGSSAKSLATMAGKRVESLSMTNILSVAAIVFLAALAIILALPLHGVFDNQTSLLTNLATSSAIILVCAVLVGLSSWFINVNRFSSHALYRNRLARAFLGSARGNDRSPTRDPFTGFDDADNVRVADMSTIPPGETHPRLFHVINMALNVVAGPNNAWQERKAESFVVTPLACGSANVDVSYSPTSEYAGNPGLKMGTAIAISGAAASPNQGYHSSPLIGLIMTLFNVRLGWWLGNPSCKSTAALEGPRWGFWQVIQEMFGLTTDSSSYVYLSDGGHFENLGLYEMVRRRCHLIVVSDGGCDPDCAFEDLGNAVRKIWIDLGVGIDFQKIDVQKRGYTRKALYCALGTIKYPESNTPGYVLYIKPGFHNDGREPADVTAYALANVAFPHETTADQFFTESQMESYRSLGAYIIKTILGEKEVPNTEAPTEALQPYWAHLKSYLNQHDQSRRARFQR